MSDNKPDLNPDESFIDETKIPGSPSFGTNLKNSPFLQSCGSGRGDAHYCDMNDVEVPRTPAPPGDKRER